MLRLSFSQRYYKTISPLTRFIFVAEKSTIAATMPAHINALFMSHQMRLNPLPWLTATTMSMMKRSVNMCNDYWLLIPINVHICLTAFVQISFQQHQFLSINYSYRGYSCKRNLSKVCLPPVTWWIIRFNYEYFMINSSCPLLSVNIHRFSHFCNPQGYFEIRKVTF